MSYSGIKPQSYTLADAVQRNIDSKGEFVLPSKNDMVAFQRDPSLFYVKLCFQTIGAAERMWVENIHKQSNGFYCGTLDNVPQDIEGLVHGDRVMFLPKHIFQIKEIDLYSKG